MITAHLHKEYITAFVGPLDLKKSFLLEMPGHEKSGGACGAMDNASDYGSEDSRFESWQARNVLLSLNYHGSE